MRRRTLLGVLLAAAIVLTAAPAGASRDALGPVVEKQEGIAFTAWWRTLYDGDAPEEAMTNLADTGANSVSILATWYQRRVTSTRILPNRSTPSDEGVVHMIREAHSLGLDVLLKPHVDLAHDPSHWRGEIGEGWNRRSPQWDAWFASYRRFLFHYADLAEREGVERFSVGCELSGTVGRTRQWREVIRGVDRRFSGDLIYAATVGGEEHAIRWWDDLDLIGVDAYYDLTDSNDPTAQDLADAWAPHVEDLAGLSTEWDRPIVFTEIGYRSIDGANTAPWDWQRTGTIDLQEQADCYRAAFDAVWDQPWFAGTYWWDWSAVPGEGGSADDGYTPFGKPAEDVLRDRY